MWAWLILASFVQIEIEQYGDPLPPASGTRLGSLSGGQFYSIWRQLWGSQDWVQVGTVAAKKFNDPVVPSGIVAAAYQVKAHRGTQVSAGAEPVTVLFGSQQQQAA